MAEPEYPVLKELETKLKLQWIDTNDYMATQRAIIEVTPDHAYLELPRGRKGDKGDPGNAISFQGIVARTSDLPTGLGASDAAKAWVNTATKALHVWNGNQWFTVNDFAGVDGDVQRFSQWFAQAADAARAAVDAADRAEYWANEVQQNITGDFATKNYVTGEIKSLADTYGGFQSASVNVDTLLAGGTNSNSRVFYRMASWGSAPNGDSGVLDVTNTGYIFSQVFYSTSTGAVYTRTITDRSHIVPGQWIYGDWVRIAVDDKSRMAAGDARRAAVVEAGLKRRGGVVGTGGKPAIALRFDHHLQQFGDKVLPHLKRLRLPWGQVINAGNIGSGNDTWTWAQLATECHNSGGEVWNHALTHGDVGSEFEADQAVTLGLSQLRENLPSLWVDSWAPPGQSNYMGFTNQAEPEKFYDTYPGKLVLAQHAFVRGSYPGPHHPLNGQNLIGQSHVTIDAQTAAWCEAAVRSARDTGSGLTMMLHSNYLDQSGYMTTNELVQVLEYIAARRDAGEIVVLSNAGILMADANTPVRQTNMLSNAGAGNSTGTWSQSVNSRSYRVHLGVPHEAETWVKGSGQVTLKVEVASPTNPVTSQHQVTLGSAPQRLSVLVTPPNDTTGITVSLTGNVQHTGINYRPI